MKQTNAIKYAYAAGIIDGEGCIRINTRNPRRGRSRNYSLLVTAVQKDGSIVDWLFGNFGGMVHARHKDREKENTYGSGWIYEWRISERNAYEFLKKITPFLVYKKPQGELAIRFQERRIHGRKKESNGKHFRALSDNEVEKREAMYQEMRRLKKVYAISKNPNVVNHFFKCDSMVQE